jgi:hypothetical protein
MEIAPEGSLVRTGEGALMSGWRTGAVRRGWALIGQLTQEL